MHFIKHTSLTLMLLRERTALHIRRCSGGFDCCWLVCYGGYAPIHDAERLPSRSDPRVSVGCLGCSHGIRVRSSRMGSSAQAFLARVGRSAMYAAVSSKTPDRVAGLPFLGSSRRGHDHACD